MWNGLKTPMELQAGVALLVNEHFKHVQTWDIPTTVGIDRRNIAAGILQHRSTSRRILVIVLYLRPGTEAKYKPEVQQLVALAARMREVEVCLIGDFNKLNLEGIAQGAEAWLRDTHWEYAEHNHKKLEMTCFQKGSATRPDKILVSPRLLGETRDIGLLGIYNPPHQGIYVTLNMGIQTWIEQTAVGKIDYGRFRARPRPLVEEFSVGLAQFQELARGDISEAYASWSGRWASYLDTWTGRELAGKFSHFGHMPAIVNRDDAMQKPRSTWLRRLQNLINNIETLSMMQDRTRPQALHLWELIERRQQPFARRYGVPPVPTGEGEDMHSLTTQLSTVWLRTTEKPWPASSRQSHWMDATLSLRPSTRTLAVARQ